MITNCNGFVYSIGAALLDRDNPACSRQQRVPPRRPARRDGGLRAQRVLSVRGHLRRAERLHRPVLWRRGHLTALCFCRVDEVLDFLAAHSTVF